MKHHVEKKPLVKTLYFLILATFPASSCFPENLSASDFTSMSLEDLMKVNVMDTPVMSASKKVQRLADAPAAIHVITSDDIGRSGLQNLPDLLRLAPGMSVNRYDGNEWAISARGFEDIDANKLLVLQDGRTLYNHGMSGVFWALQDAVLDDIDRIEVIRGPGATLWGANAVNGVINIVNKDASQTLGFLTDTHVGTDMQTQSVRYGFKIDDNTYARVYGKFRLIEDSVYSSTAGDREGENANDHMDDGLFGFRVDRHMDSADFMITGEAIADTVGSTSKSVSLTPPYMTMVDLESNQESVSLVSKWTKRNADSEYSIQGFYSGFYISNGLSYGHREDTLDIELQDRFKMGDRNEINWGMDYRAIFDHSDTRMVGMDPAEKSSHLFSVFVEDCWTIVPKKLNLYVGSKLELSSYADPAVQPSARFSWTPDSKQTLWGAVSRAIRTPSRSEQDVHGAIQGVYDPGSGNVMSLIYTPNHAVDSEELYAYELGYRIQPANNLTFDLSGFLNSYRHLVGSHVSSVQFNPAPVPHLDIFNINDNEIGGKTWGLELEVNWNAARNWKLTGSYSWIDGDFDSAIDATSTQSAEVAQKLENRLIHNQFQIHSAWDISRDLSLNAGLYYEDLIVLGDVPPYFRLDLNVSWRPNKHTEIILGASSILNDSYPEWLNSLNNFGTETQRAAYVNVVFKF